MFLGPMWASDCSKNKWGEGWGGGGEWTHQAHPHIDTSTYHLCKFCPVWQRWTYGAVTGARTCTTLVGLSLNFTKVWVLDKPRLLLYWDLDTGYPSSQSRIFKFKWPHDQLHSVSTGVESAIDESIVSKLFCPVTSLHNIKYNITKFYLLYFL